MVWNIKNLLGGNIMRKIFMFNFSARKRKSVVSATMSFIILISTLNCTLSLGSSASFEKPNNDPSQNISSQTSEKDILIKDLNLIDFLDCLYNDHRFSPFFRLIEKLLDCHTNSPISRSIYERTLKFFVKKKSEMQNPKDLEELDKLKQDTWDEFNRLREGLQNYYGNANEESCEYDNMEEDLLATLECDPSQTQEDVAPRPETSSPPEDTSLQTEDTFLILEFPTIIEVDDYTQPEIDSSGSEGNFDADGYLRPLSLMPDIAPPHYSVFLGK